MKMMKRRKRKRRKRKRRKKRRRGTRRKRSQPRPSSSISQSNLLLQFPREPLIFVDESLDLFAEKFFLVFVRGDLLFEILDLCVVFADERRKETFVWVIK